MVFSHFSHALTSSSQEIVKEGKTILGFQVQKLQPVFSPFCCFWTVVRQNTMVVKYEKKGDCFTSTRKQQQMKVSGTPYIQETHVPMTCSLRMGLNSWSFQYFLN